MTFICGDRRRAELPGDWRQMQGSGQGGARRQWTVAGGASAVLEEAPLGKRCPQPTAGSPTDRGPARPLSNETQLPNGN